MPVGQNIAFLCRALSYGGAERQLVLLAEELDRRGYPVTIYTFYPTAEITTKVPVISLEKKHRWDLAGFLWRLYKALRRHDVVYSYLTIPNLLSSLLAPNKAILGVRASNMDWSRYDRLAIFTAWLEKILAPRAKGIIVNSWAGLQHLNAQGFKSDRIQVIPNGVDFQRFTTIAPRPKSHKTVALIARLDPMKDHETFIKAAHLVHQQDPSVRFLCVGTGPDAYKRHLMALAGNLPITWQEPLANIETIYPQCDVVCLTSAYGEGTPNVLLEAMACGIPCVSTDVGDAARVLEGQGIVVPVGDAQALAAGIMASFGSIIQRDTLVQRYSLSSLTDQTITAFQQWNLLS